MTATSVLSSSTNNNNTTNFISSILQHPWIVTLLSFVFAAPNEDSNSTSSIAPAGGLASSLSSFSSNSASSSSPFVFFSLSFWEQYIPTILLNSNIITTSTQTTTTTDLYLMISIVLLTLLASIQLRIFIQPTPVPLKLLPKRPTISILFKPDDPSTPITTTTTTTTTTNSTVATTTASSILMMTTGGGIGTAGTGTTDTAGSTSNTTSTTTTNKHKRGIVGLTTDIFRRRGRNPSSSSSNMHNTNKTQRPKGQYDDDAGYDEEEGDGHHMHHSDIDDDDEYFEAEAESEYCPHGSTNTNNINNTSSFRFTGGLSDLPDSFAPLLSSSNMEILQGQLTADLIHAIHGEIGIRMREGRHEIPLDKDTSRPQLMLHVPKGGVRISAIGIIGSDGFTKEQDLNVFTSTSIRSKPIVKNAGMVFDPPLPLSNVAPTLIHFPTLFDDNVIVPTLRRIQLIRLFIDFIISISSLLEKCLWILESKCQIHLSKVRIIPIYKGHGKKKKDHKKKNPSKSNPPIISTDAYHHDQDHHVPSPPDWRLSLSFSGHVLLFGFIPIPFISVTLPTFIIPQPHALLDYLLSSQPLASARLRRENIAEERIVLALINTAETWNASCKIVATPPVVGVDITLPGGVAVAMELAFGRDPHAGRYRTEMDTSPIAYNNNSNNPTFLSPRSPMAMRNDTSSVNSLSSWTTHLDTSETKSRGVRKATTSQTGNNNSTLPAPYDANVMIPWLIEFAAKGWVSDEKMSVHVLKMSATHEDNANGVGSTVGGKGSFAIWKVKSGSTTNKVEESIPLRRSSSFGRRVTTSFGHPELETADTPSVAAILFFPEETKSYHSDLRLLQYDYVFDVFDDTKIDAVTISVGATHPMLNGGTMATTIFDSMYAYGSMSARENAILDPEERHRKRNILRHLPAIDFTFGIQSIYIPMESESYSDDGQTLFLPELDGGRMMIRVLGGIGDGAGIGSNSLDENSADSNMTISEPVMEGVKLFVDFEAASLCMRTEGSAKEFPEFEIFEGMKMRSDFLGVVAGSIRAHLRSQKLNPIPSSATGPNVFNPLEAYEIDFSQSSCSVKIKEYVVTLGHRRVIFPTESTFLVKVVESVVDMGFEGKTQCDLSWDFQGLSPILQATSLGQSPADAVPENKEQVSLLVAPLRQGRISFHVSSVGGIKITKAATSREDKEGLYDWKFFNALVSPDGESAGRIIDVLHDMRTMDKLLQVVRLLNVDLHRLLGHCLKQVWRTKEILDKEGISDPAHAIPMYKMTRLLSLFLTGSDEQVKEILPIVQKVVVGDGLDVVKIKEVIRTNWEHYDDWAPEIDRVVRWLAVAFGPMSVTQPYVEQHVVPLAELPYHAARFRSIPSASQLYQSLLDKQHLPLDPVFSGLVSRVAPYLSFRQIEFVLQVRISTDWQPADLRRIRYVYSIKRKVLDIAESYGGLTFLPQSFLVSVFLGEATRTSHRARLSGTTSKKIHKSSEASVASLRARKRAELVRGSGSSTAKNRSHRISTLSRLRKRRGQLDQLTEEPMEEDEDRMLSPAEQVASYPNLQLADDGKSDIPENLFLESGRKLGSEVTDGYELGDSLLGPQDVAILLQAGLTSVMKSSTVVQLNQRMLIDLMCSQPPSFPVAVLAEIGTNGGQASPRSLTSALMALLELDQSSFKPNHKIDMHALLESWLPGLKIPRRDDYMAGGRWARQSYYEALFSVANSILDDAEPYMALIGHLQQVRHNGEIDMIPRPREEKVLLPERAREVSSMENLVDESSSKLTEAIDHAKSLIAEADKAGKLIMESLIVDEELAKENDDYEKAISRYREAFSACSRVLQLDKYAFHASWFGDFYQRNYHALTIKSMFDNVTDNVDSTRYWLHALRKGAKRKHQGGIGADVESNEDNDWEDTEDIFLEPHKSREQVLIDEIIDATVYEEKERERLRNDPLVRLLIPNPPGNYNFVIISAMGVITEGKTGLELKDAFRRLEEKRGVTVIRADTGTARSLTFNASKIEEAIEIAVGMKKPYGLLGYSQGCANALMAESTLLSGSPKQQQLVKHSSGGLVCRQLLFNASNGSFHGPAMEKKTQRLIAMCEDFFKYQQGYFSRALASSILEIVISILDSSQFHKVMGGAQSFLPDGCLAFWREAQHLAHVPTCTLKGVLEEHTTPECLEMLSALLSKQSGSHLHDSQVHVFDAVGYPVYIHNRNGKILRKCAIGESTIQRTHHWSPLSDEVEFVRTVKDLEMASFDCAKDRHVFPWVDVNARFGFIKYEKSTDKMTSVPSVMKFVSPSIKQEVHPVKLMSSQGKFVGDHRSVALYSMTP